MCVSVCLSLPPPHPQKNTQKNNNTHTHTYVCSREIKKFSRNTLLQQLLRVMNIARRASYLVICGNQTCILWNRGVYDFCLEKAEQNTFVAGPCFPDNLSFLLVCFIVSLFLFWCVFLCAYISFYICFIVRQALLIQFLSWSVCTTINYWGQLNYILFHLICGGRHNRSLFRRSHNCNVLSVCLCAVVMERHQDKFLCTY